MYRAYRPRGSAGVCRNEVGRLDRRKIFGGSALVLGLLSERDSHRRITIPSVSTLLCQPFFCRPNAARSGVLRVSAQRFLNPRNLNRRKQRERRVPRPPSGRRRCPWLTSFPSVHKIGVGPPRASRAPRFKVFGLVDRPRQRRVNFVPLLAAPKARRRRVPWW